MKRTVLLTFITIISCLLLFSVSNIIAQEPCTADFNCSQTVDANDVTTFLSQFGRSPFNDPCPDCYDSPCPCTTSSPNYYEFCGTNDDCDSGCCCNEADSDRCHDQTYCESVIGSQCINSNESCITGQTRECGTDIGECVFGTETCIDGLWGNCVGGITPVNEVCNDGLDNDCDGYADCDDFDCASNPACSESNCSDGIDNDGDGYTDCDDFDCALDPACEGIFETNCTDNIDNDGDGYTDCDDFDCNKLDPACEGVNCSDGIDNDGDGFVDCDDFDCTSDPACV